MASVYIETTIPSYYFDTRRAATVRLWREITRTWWDRFRSNYELVTSPLVLDEIGRARQPKAAEGLRLLLDIRLLDAPRRVAEVTEYYIAQKLMPRAAGADAIHLALASIHGIDFLLTWNCKHLANANKARHIGVLNGRLGLPTPVVTTPLTLLPEGMTP